MILILIVSHSHTGNVTSLYFVVKSSIRWISRGLFLQFFQLLGNLCEGGYTCNFRCMLVTQQFSKKLHYHCKQKISRLCGCGFTAHWLMQTSTFNINTSTQLTLSVFDGSHLLCEWLSCALSKGLGSSTIAMMDQVCWNNSTVHQKH